MITGIAAAVLEPNGHAYFLYDLAILLDHIEMRGDYPALWAALLDDYGHVRRLAEEYHDVHRPG